MARACINHLRISARMLGVGLYVADHTHFYALRMRMLSDTVHVQNCNNKKLMTPYKQTIVQSRVARTLLCRKLLHAALWEEEES